MSIRRKLLFVVFSVMIAFGIAASVYFLIRSPLARINSEETILSDLKVSLLNETIQLERLASVPFNKQLDAFEAATRATMDEFKRTETITLLPRLVPTVDKSLQKIRELKAVHDQAVSTFVFSVVNIQNDANTAGQNADTFTLLSLATARSELGKQRTAEMQGDVEESLKGISQLSLVMEQMSSTIAEQSNAIAHEVAMVQARANFISVIIAVVMLTLAVVVSLVMTNRIAGSIASIEQSIAEMGSGDLTADFSVRTQDEVGKLSMTLSNLEASLRSSLTEAQQVSNENLEMKQSLVVATEQASASTHQINASTESISGQISSLDENVSESTSAFDDISESIHALNDEIQGQMTMIEESTASVTEMIASIDNVASTAEKRREATDKLVRTVAAGGERMAATLGVVKEINQSVDSIKNITGMIGAIAAQTNLLAMNAAIEAAHAGDAGLGFSVVADEIRKLAEAATDNSKEIGKVLKVIVSRIDDAGTTGSDMNEAFGEIDHEVRELASSLTEIFASMTELRSGGDQILQAMTVLQGASVHVKDGSLTINSSTSHIRETMQMVHNVSSQVRNGMNEISSGMGEIAASVGNVLQIAERLGELGESLNESITGFKTS